MAASLESVSPVSFESASAVTASPSVQLGTVKVDNSGNKFIYVYNGGNAQISQGQGAFLSPSNYSSGFTVSVSNAASQSGGERMLGVAHHATIATGYYGWVMAAGVALVALDASQISMNAGDILVPGVDGGFVVKAGTSATALPVGLAINSLVTTVGTGKAWIKAPFFG